MLPTLAEQIAVERIDADRFVSKVLPEKTGNALPIAYGGCSIAVAVHAACKTVADDFRVYSVLGSFLGPTAINRVVYCRIVRLRDTRTFATRHVTVYQLQDNCSERICTQMSVEFQVEEPALLIYHTPPNRVYGTDPQREDVALPTALNFQKLIQKGLVTAAAADMRHQQFKLVETHFETRHSVKSVNMQNALGLVKLAKTTQDHRPIYEKTCAEWTRARTKLNTYHENLAALSFLLDGGLSFLPLHLNHMDFDDSAACSTLDFALRIIATSVELEKWHLKERSTTAASAGRTYSEQKLWARDGQVIAIMSQTSILRPKASAAPVLGARL